MPTFTAKEYTAEANENSIIFTATDKKPAVEVPYGALSAIKWAPDEKKINAGKAPLTEVNFIYRNSEQNKLPSSLRVGKGYAKATLDNMQAITYIRERMSAAEPMPDWKQEVDPDAVKKGKIKDVALKVAAALILVLIVFGVFKACSAGSDETIRATPDTDEVTSYEGATIEVMCHAAVESSLPPVDDYKFADTYYKDSIRRIDDSDTGKFQEWRYKSYVVVPNMYGVDMRHYFLCHAVPKGDTFDVNVEILN